MPRGRQFTADERKDIARSTDSAQELANRYECALTTIYRIKRDRSRPQGAGPVWRYTEEDKERALTEYVIKGGKASRACRHLDAAGVLRGLSAATLNTWAAAEPERVERIRAELIPTIHGDIASAHEEIAIEAAEATHKAIELALSRLSEVAPRDMPGAARNLATVLAISTEKAALLRGKPTVIEERRDVGEILSALERMGVKVENAQSPQPPEAIEGSVAEPELA